MYTIIVQDNNTMLVTIKERIMQRSKLMDSLHFLVEPLYKDEIDMTGFTAVMEYILPVSREYKTELLTLSEELYKDKLEYKLPLDTKLTREAGDIEVQLSFTKTDIDEDGLSYQYVRKTSPCVITITPVSAWSDIVPDSALTALDQRMLKVDAQIKALSETGDIMAATKADNIILDNETNELYLTANGSRIGDKINLGDLGDRLAESSEEGLIQIVL